MKIIDYKLVSKIYLISHVLDDVEDGFTSSNMHFEKLIKKHLENDYTPLGGVSVIVSDIELSPYDSENTEGTNYILMQSLVLYGK